MSQAVAVATQQSANSIDASTVYVARFDDLPRGLPPIVSRIAELFDGSRSIEQVAVESRISVSKASAVVRKLTGLGILYTPTLRLETPTKLSEIAAPVFSEEEEAFFSAELEPIDMCDEPFSPPLGERAGLFVSELILRLKGSPAF